MVTHTVPAYLLPVLIKICEFNASIYDITLCLNGPEQSPNGTSVRWALFPPSLRVSEWLTDCTESLTHSLVTGGPASTSREALTSKNVNISGK